MLGVDLRVVLRAMTPPNPKQNIITKRHRKEISSLIYSLLNFLENPVSSKFKLYIRSTFVQGKVFLYICLSYYLSSK